MGKLIISILHVDSAPCPVLDAGDTVMSKQARAWLTCRLPSSEVRERHKIVTQVNRKENFFPHEERGSFPEQGIGKDEQGWNKVKPWGPGRGR